VKPISNGAGRTPINPNLLALRSCLKTGNEAFIIYDCKTKNWGNSRNTDSFTIEGNKIKEVEVYFGYAPKEPA
jgi:hypothetical protein